MAPISPHASDPFGVSAPAPAAQSAFPLIEEFKAAALKLDHVADCAIEMADDGVQITIHAYLAKSDGTAEHGHARFDIAQHQFDEGSWSTPGPWLLQTFDRTIAAGYLGFIRYATADEIAAAKAKLVQEGSAST